MAATVTRNQTPADQLIAEATKPVVVEDSRGRKITLAKPGVLAQFKMVKLLGDSASNETYRNMVLPLIFVTDIDGEPVYFPKTEGELEAIIVRLDEHGINAVLEGVQTNFGEAEDAGAKDDLKN